MKVVRDYYFEGMRSIPLNEWLGKLVNRKHSEAVLQCKKDINQKSKVFASHSWYPYYWFLWGECKELQSKGRINQVFCLGAVVTVKITENSQAIKVINEKDLMVCKECQKDFFLSQLLLTSSSIAQIFNFSASSILFMFLALLSVNLILIGS